ALLDRGRAALLVQGDARAWWALEGAARALGRGIRPGRWDGRVGGLALHAGADTQSQAAIVKGILAAGGCDERTVVVLPDPGSLIPLLTEIAAVAGEFNVSVGYPLARCAPAGLLQAVAAAQASRREGAYRARDYLRVLAHPLLKNARFDADPAVTRTLVHAVEEVLSGRVPSPVGGALFIRLEEMEGLGELFGAASTALSGMGVRAEPGEIPGLLAALHAIAFRAWEEPRTFESFAGVLGRFMDTLLERSGLERHFLNLRAAARIIGLGEEMGRASFAGERFPPEELFRIFLHLLAGETVSFAGAPLEGLQVLGLLETRALSFDTVIVMDANESVLPRLRPCEPLIPREVMVSLGLDRVEREEEDQRHHLMRLLAGARRVHLVYNDSPDRERSRFIEELVWRAERDGEKAPAPRRAAFRAAVVPRRGVVEKDGRAVERLAAFTFSPTSLDAYLCCPLAFYHRYVLRLREREAPAEEPERADVGTFIHALLADAFRPHEGRRPAVDAGFRRRLMDEFRRRFADEFERRMRSDSFMLARVMEYRLERFLDHERGREVRGLLAVERDIGRPLALAGRTVRFACRADRIDALDDGRILVVDYKTGSAAETPRCRSLLGMESFPRKAVRAALRSFQLPLSRTFARMEYPGAEVGTALYLLGGEPALREFPGEGFADGDERLTRACEGALEAVVLEILDPARPFEADEGDPRLCGRCPFSRICR
ncbi:MAG: PD-(D/E)XK nuclease family protein, partial [bacterium]|nr:PD-(D/E)XK nuclease family protein [bacterium]